MSHTLTIINEALEEIKAYTYDKYQNQMPMAHRFAKLTFAINNFLAKLDIHIIKKSLVDQLLLNSYDSMGKWSCIGTFLSAQNDYARWDNIYELLNDDDSKKIYDRFIQYRTAYSFLDDRAKDIFPSETGNDLVNLKYNGHGYIVNTYCINSEVLTIKESWEGAYQYKNLVKPEGKDVIIDAGAFKGETSIWFADKIKKGQIIAIEPSQNSFNALVNNIQYNSLQSIIVPICCGLSDNNDFAFIAGNGNPGDKLSPNVGKQIELITIDNLTQKYQYSKISFIKMDIEGSELSALHGAMNVLHTFKPKLAICVYHRPTDLLDIMEFLNSLKLGYTFYLKQASNNWTETILFCK